jgi:PAS domain S-box-containing protein
MFRTDFKNSIQYKFLKDISIILLISTCVLTAVIAFNERNMLKDSLTTKGLSYASNIAKRNENALIVGGGIKLDSVLSELITDEEIIYTIIEDNEKNILTTQFESINYKWPGLKEILPTLSRDSELPDIIAAIKKRVNVREVSVPIVIGTDTLGTVAIGMSESKINKQIAKTVLFVIALNIMVAVVLGVVLFMSSKKTIFDPIIELRQSAERFAKGDLTTPVTIKTMGEIQVLVNSLNTMAEDLNKKTVSKDYMDNMISSMMDTVIVVSPEGSIERVNKAACSLLGYEEQELVGRPLESTIVDEPGAQLPGMSEVLSQGSISTSERTYLAKGGRKIPVLFSASVMRDAQNAVQGVVCVAQDISDRKQVEEKLQAYSEELQEINDDLKSFAYIVSHDLRAPLVNIKGFSEELIHGIKELSPLLEKYLSGFEQTEQEKFREVLQKDIPEALKFIGSSVKRMDNLINAVLRLSHVGRRKFNPEPVIVQELIQTVVNSLAHQIESGKIRMTVRDLPDVVADRTALEQIFGNLIDNAVKYLQPGRVGEIEIFGESRPREVVFHVRDNGRGMAHEDIPRAFEIFRRVGKQDVPGEGMGLAYVKTLVRFLGGRIWCQSELGAGATFSISLPVPVNEHVDNVPTGGRS